MTLHILDTKKLGFNSLGSMEIQSIATNPMASWIYLGRNSSLDRDYLNLIACQIDPATGELIGEPIFLPDSTQKSDLGRMNIGEIIVDQSRQLLYLCRRAERSDPKDFEAITIYKLDLDGRPIEIVKTCTTDFSAQIGVNTGPNDDGVYTIAIYQNHLYAVGQRINGVFIYELDNQGIPTTTTPTNFFTTTACQQIAIINDKIYLGTFGISPILQVADLDGQGVPILASIQTFPIPIGVANEYLDFQISNQGIYPQKTELSKSNRPSVQPLYYLPFDASGLPTLPLQTIAAEVRGFGVNSNNDLWFATDDPYVDAIDGSVGDRGIKVQTYPPANDYSAKLKFSRLVSVAENGTPVLLCDSYFKNGEDFGNQNTISGWYIRFKVNKALPSLNPAKTFVLEGKPAQSPQVGISIELGTWSEAISLDPFLRSTHQQIIMKFGHKRVTDALYPYDRTELTELEVEIEIHQGLPGIGVNKISLPPETTLGDLVEFWLPGYGVQDLPGESSLEQRFAANLIEWSSQRVQRQLTELQAVSLAAVQPQQFTVSAYGPIGYQPSSSQLKTTAELLAYMGFNASIFTKYFWTGLDANQINTAVNSHLPYRNGAVGFPLDGLPNKLNDFPLCYFYFFLTEPTVIYPVLNLWVNRVSSDLFKNGATSANIREIPIADEPGWNINLVVTKVRASADYLKKFQDFLYNINKNENPITPEDLGAAVGESFYVLIPALITLPSASLADRRLYYWTVRFLVESASDGFGEIARLMSSYLVGVNQPNLFAPVNKSSLGGLWGETGRWYGGGLCEPDWFDLGRKSVPSISAENWSGDTFGLNVSYTANLMRCAAQLGNEKRFSATIRGLRLSDTAIPSYAVMTYAGYGCKDFTVFNYGHGSYQIDSWSEYPELFPAIRNALDMLGQTEDLLYPGQPPLAQVAVLHPAASDLWNEFGYTCLYQVEAHGIYHALRHAGYAVDLIDEVELKNNFFNNGQYRVLYITGPNIPRASIEKLKAWVVAGNTAIITNGAAMRDEYHERLVGADDVDLLDSLLGLVNDQRTEDRTYNGFNGALTLSLPTQTVNIVDSRYGNDANFLLCNPSHSLQPEEATIVASVNNEVLVVEHQLQLAIGRINGSGKTVTFGTYAGAAYMMNSNIVDFVDARTSIPSNWNTVLRKLIIAPVEQLGITKPVEIDQDLEIECCRLESAVGIGIVLLNWSGRKVETLMIKVTNNGAFTNVKSVKQGILVATVVGANLEIELTSLENVDVLMLT
jgi:hypothetical protein